MGGGVKYHSYKNQSQISSIYVHVFAMCKKLNSNYMLYLKYKHKQISADPWDRKA